MNRCSLSECKNREPLLRAFARGVTATAICREAGLRSALKQLGRPALHAKTLGFQHPDGRQLSFDSNLPTDFLMLMQQLDELPSHRAE